MNAAELGKQIRSKRKSMGITLHELARMTGLSYATLRAVELANNQYRNATLIRILKVLDLNPEVEKPVKQQMDAEMEKHLDQILKLATVETVSISISGTDKSVAYAKTYRK